MTEHEKIELPKFMCDWLDKQLITLERYPMGAVAELNEIRVDNDKVATWLNADSATQWLLIDALRYGYVTEPEPRWGIKAGNCYMVDASNWSFDNVLPETVIKKCWWGNEEDAMNVVKMLGFGEVVNLNKEDNR